MSVLTPSICTYVFVFFSRLSRVMVVALVPILLSTSLITYSSEYVRLRTLSEWLHAQHGKGGEN